MGRYSELKLVSVRKWQSRSNIYNRELIVINVTNKINATNIIKQAHIKNSRQYYIGVEYLLVKYAGRYLAAIDQPKYRKQCIDNRVLPCLHVTMDRKILV